MFNLLPWRKRRKNQLDHIHDKTDRDKILEMMANLDDQSSISILKKVYNINDRELVAKKNKLIREKIKRSIAKTQDELKTT